MILYHTGGSEIRKPDLGIGRSNADFGQGFYLSTDESFAGSWARERTASDIFVNKYELDTDGLVIRSFEKGAEWYDFIIGNRRGSADNSIGNSAGKEYDIVIGPVAGDTLFETYGMITSGVLPREQAIELFCIGPAFEQLVIRTERAAAKLKWISARVLNEQNIKNALAGYAAAKEEYEAQLYSAINSML